MSDEPESIVPRLLRENREILYAHSGMHQKHQEAIEALNRKIDAWQETTATGIGLAIHANVRHENLETRPKNLERRVEEFKSELLDAIAALSPDEFSRQLAAVDQAIREERL
ncbi:MAG: hypothetical protein ACREDV_11715 [Methylocella sp.]